MSNINPITGRDPNSTLLKGKSREYYELYFEIRNGILYRSGCYSPVTLKINSGNFYPRLSVGGVKLKAHVLVFFLTTGRAGGIIDHIDGNKANFHAYNLRETDNSGNQIASYKKVETRTNSENIDRISRKSGPPVYRIRFGGSKKASPRFWWPIRYSSLLFAEHARDTCARNIYEAFRDATRGLQQNEKTECRKLWSLKIKEKYSDHGETKRTLPFLKEE